MIIALIVSLVIYGLLIFYIGWSGHRGLGLSRNRWFVVCYSIILVFLSVSFIIGRLGNGSAVFSIIGNYWLAIFGLLLLTLPITHLVMLILRFTRIDRNKTRVVATTTVLVLVISTLMYGSYLAYTPKMIEYNITIAKPNVDDMKIVMISDTHFGYLSGINHAKRLVEEVNKLNADLILFPGDIIDDDLDVVEKKGIFEILRGMKSKYGVFGSLGNHDKYRGQMDKLISSIETANIKLLYDEVYELNDEIYIVGRKDKTESDRRATSELIAGLDQSKPIFLLDHQPYEFDLAEEAGVDLLVAGHTHKGQIAPGNLITKKLFENDYGYLRKGNLHTIVSSGYGFWGPPIRIGSQSEIVVINVTFE